MNDELLELLEELHHYFDNKADVNDGDYGVPEANYEMAMASRIAKLINDETIGENR
jgi:hypothetical protein